MKLSYWIAGFVFTVCAQAALSEPIVAVVDLEYKSLNGVFIQSDVDGSGAAYRIYSLIKDIFFRNRVRHGDSMANIVSHVNPNAEIFKIQIDNTLGGLVNAIHYLNEMLESRRPQVVNISIVADMPCMPSLQRVINEGTKKGIVFVAALGNDGARTTPTPAACDGVIAVGSSVHGTRTPTKFSNRSDKGVYIDIDPTEFVAGWNKGYVGTSYSTAVVSAMISLSPHLFRDVSPADTSQKLEKIANWLVKKKSTTASN